MIKRKKRAITPRDTRIGRRLEPLQTARPKIQPAFRLLVRCSAEPGRIVDRIGPNAAGQGVWSWVHIDDAAAATAAALECPAGIYNVVDGDPTAQCVWLPAFARAVGSPPSSQVTEEEALAHGARRQAARCRASQRLKEQAHHKPCTAAARPAAPADHRAAAARHPDRRGARREAADPRFRCP
jgi:hypothetical protein